MLQSPGDLMRLGEESIPHGGLTFWEHHLPISLAENPTSHVEKQEARRK
jgi:hypothetical protein